mmetsp:Transcript_83085/g.173924  ORF Transcript_83085/g.173924 Transcript_83085/m.173924 type:complete len:89 (+) Transcript_83085:495-761(+)
MHRQEPSGQQVTEAILSSEVKSVTWLAITSEFQCQLAKKVCKQQNRASSARVRGKLGSRNREFAEMRRHRYKAPCKAVLTGITGTCLH